MSNASTLKRFTFWLTAVAVALLLALLSANARATSHRCLIDVGYTVSSLPLGYNSLLYNNRRYFHHGGHFYQPAGSRFTVVAAPIGLRVGALHGGHRPFRYGGLDYSYSHGSYYHRRHDGYVVSRDPFFDGYGRHPDDVQIFRSAGQSQQQLSRDREECGETAVAETGYSAAESGFDSAAAYSYRPIFRACLERRGYTVK